VTTSPDRWFEEYGRGRDHPVNRALQWLCIPLIVIGLVGMLWSLPVPQAFTDISPLLNWGTAFLMASTVYYFILSFSLALGILPFVAAVVFVVAWLEMLHWPLWSISAALFVAAWTGRWAGCVLEGERAPLWRDLQLVMIGPVWLLAACYRRAGIPY
jgi:hypothetical protein